jgi:hypothetical protein
MKGEKMARRLRLSEPEMVQSARVALENTLNDADIKELMEASGYDEAQIQEGLALVAAAEALLAHNQKESRETLDAKKLLDEKISQLTKGYRIDRKKARAIFNSDPYALTKLDLAKVEPAAESTWIATVETFYQVASEDESIQQKLARLKIDAEAVAAAQTLIGEVKAARRLYDNERVEDQDATTRKKAAIKALDDWMREFYTVAKIMLEERPELLEKLGFFVRS